MTKKYANSTLFFGGTLVDVLSGTLEKTDILVENGIIKGVGRFEPSDACEAVDISGKYICPGFIDGHIHVESSYLTPAEFAAACLPHGTTAAVIDPHEIANVCGTDGIDYMLASSEGLPVDLFMALPSCVPSSPFDESGAFIGADDLKEYYNNPRVVALGEVMNYPGVIAGNVEIMRKINDAINNDRVVDGHAPTVTGNDLDKYIAAGITSDHECGALDEAMERLEKGQWVMIRQGTAARNLEALLPLFDSKYSSRCLLVCDDKHPADIIGSGHIDSIIRLAAKRGKSVVTGIQMATINAARRFGLKNTGAVAEGYNADFLILDELESVAVERVYKKGMLVAENGKAIDFKYPEIDDKLRKAIYDTVNIRELTPDDFRINIQNTKARAIKISGGGLLTKELICDGKVDTDKDKDIILLAVAERHKNTGHIGLGFVSGLGLKRGAIASSVSHDAHNLIIAGTNGEDMALAANRLRTLGGGQVVACDGKIIAELALPVAGLMTEKNAAETAADNARIREVVHSLGAPENVEPFMNLAFISLPVIPDLKMTTMGLIDVNRQCLVPLFID